jgi:hypothetical protein
MDGRRGRGDGKRGRSPPSLALPLSLFLPSQSRDENSPSTQAPVLIRQFQPRPSKCLSVSHTNHRGPADPPPKVQLDPDDSLMHPSYLFVESSPPIEYQHIWHRQRRPHLTGPWRGSMGRTRISSIIPRRTSPSLPSISGNSSDRL